MNTKNLSILLAVVFLSQILSAMDEGPADSYEYIALQIAVQNSDYVTLEQKLINPNEVSADGISLISLAAAWRHPAMVTYLQSKGANINLLHHYKDDPEEAPATVLDNALAHPNPNPTFISFLRNNGAKTSAQLGYAQP